MYHGPLKTAAQAARWARDIRANHPGDGNAAGAARMLETSWQSVAARPELAIRIMALAESTALHRSGGIMDRLTRKA